MVDMKCEGCVNAVKSKLETIEGRFLRLLWTALFTFYFGDLLCYYFVMWNVYLIYERDWKSGCGFG